MAIVGPAGAGKSWPAAAAAGAAPVVGALDRAESGAADVDLALAAAPPTTRCDVLACETTCFPCVSHARTP